MTTSSEERQVDGQWIVCHVIEIVGAGSTRADAWADVAQQCEKLGECAVDSRKMSDAWREQEECSS